MRFSVIIPNFNHGRLLPRAVEALMQQAPRPAEIIIIDDASTDDSLTVIGRLQARYDCIRLIPHDQNKGVVVGMNEGLRAATADYVYFAAADDYSLPGLFSAADKALAAHADAAFFCARVVHVDPDGQVLGFRPFMWPAAQAAMLTPAAVRNELTRSDNWCVGPAVIYRRQRLLAAGGFDETMLSLTDGILDRRLALESGFYFDPAPLAAWEIYPQSLSARSALSVTENKRLIARAVAEVSARFPADVRTSYADRLSRRLRFNMARLWLVFDNGRIDTVGLADVLAFKGHDRNLLEVLARLPFARFAVLAWMALVLRPYSAGAIVIGWYRAEKSKWRERKTVQGTVVATREAIAGEAGHPT